MTLIFPCFALPATQKRLILMFIDVLENDFFHSWPFSLPPHWLATKCLISLGIPVLPGSYNTNFFTVDNRCYLSPLIRLIFSNCSQG